MISKYRHTNTTRGGEAMCPQLCQFVLGYEKCDHVRGAPKFQGGAWLFCPHTDVIGIDTIAQKGKTYGYTVEADRISFSFSARKITIFCFLPLYFSAENRWRIFGFILFFGLIIPEKCRKMHWANGQMKFWNLSTSRLQLQQACMQRDWPCISRWPMGCQSHGADYTALIMQQANKLQNLATLNSAPVSTAASAAIVQTMKLTQL